MKNTWYCRLRRDPSFKHGNGYVQKIGNKVTISINGCSICITVTNARMLHKVLGRMLKKGGAS